MEKSAMNERSACIRCGTCCKNGGPTLHQGDLESMKRGEIPLTDLYTIRAGELIRNNIDGGLFQTEDEILKVAGLSDSPACRLYDPDQGACTIYPKRPVQCRAMKCWNTSEIVDLYSKARICRKDLFGSIQWLWDMIETHESACRLADIRILVEKRSFGERTASKALTGMLAYDDSVRRVVVEKAGIEPDMLPLLFGRPLSVILPLQFGIQLKKTAEENA